MKFFNAKDYWRSWSVWTTSALTALATVDLSTTWVDALIPEKHKPLVYAVFGAVTLIVRAIKQPNLGGK